MGALYASQYPKMFVPTELIDSHVYDRLCGRARNILRREASGHQLEPADLVHEALLRMARSHTPIDFQDKYHAMAITTITMRRVLVDNARSAKSLARRCIEPLGSQTELSVRPVSETLIIHILLERLEMINVRLCQIVKMRFFLGLSNSEIASILSVSERTVKRDWVSARLWLQRELANSRLREGPPV